MRRWFGAALLVTCLGCGKKPAPVEGFFDRTGLSNAHVASCDDPTCGDGTDAPVGGPHCPSALSCRTWTDAQKRCSWVHNLEHGHAVLLYNCPEGCPDDVAALAADFAAKPRRILAPDPALPNRVAALVWGHSWLGAAYDADAVATVLAMQDRDAPEPGLPCSP